MISELFDGELYRSQTEKDWEEFQDYMDNEKGIQAWKDWHWLANRAKLRGRNDLVETFLPSTTDEWFIIEQAINDLRVALKDEK